MCYLAEVRVESGGSLVSRKRRRQVTANLVQVTKLKVDFEVVRLQLFRFAVGGERPGEVSRFLEAIPSLDPDRRVFGVRIQVPTICRSRLDPLLGVTVAITIGPIIDRLRGLR